ncbi:MAG TPA: beta-propeller fold lactonase family protein [Polyangiaceae bacterium]|nr:beta-propeller fold lactonase family protein [Polyangiaceae bacterium]
MTGRCVLRRLKTAVSLVTALVALGALAAPSCGKKSFLETSKGTDEGESTAARPSASAARPSGAAASSSASSGVAAASASAAGAALVPAGGARLLVTNEDSGDVTIIDLEREEVAGRVVVGKRPRGIRVSPDGRWVFIALSGSAKSGPNVDESKLPPADRAADGIGVLDPTQWKLVRVLKSGQDPEHFDISRDGKTIFVSNEETGEASSVDVKSGEVTGRVKVGEEPEGVTLRPDGKIVYVTSEVGNQLAAVDIESRKVVATIETAPRPRSVVFTQDGKTAFVACETGGQVTVVDAVKHRRRANIKIDAAGARPMGTALSSDGKIVYVSNGRGGSVSLIDVATEKLLETIPNVGTRPWGIAVSSDGKKLYTANGPSNDVSVIDLATKTVAKRIAAGQSPWGVALTK